MSIDDVRACLGKRHKDKEIIEFDVSSATVELAAEALHVEPGRIAKTLSFWIGGKPCLIVMSGDVKIDNGKFKNEFREKAKMMSAEDAKNRIGHEIGGVCPFGIKEGVDVFLDVSLKKYDPVYPACGSANSAIKMSNEDLYEISGAQKWIDVCKDI